MLDFKENLTSFYEQLLSIKKQATFTSAELTELLKKKSEYKAVTRSFLSPVKSSTKSVHVKMNCSGVFKDLYISEEEKVLRKILNDTLKILDKDLLANYVLISGLTTPISELEVRLSAFISRLYMLESCKNISSSKIVMASEVAKEFSIYLGNIFNSNNNVDSSGIYISKWRLHSISTDIEKFNASLKRLDIRIASLNSSVKLGVSDILDMVDTTVLSSTKNCLGLQSKECKVNLQVLHLYLIGSNLSHVVMFKVSQGLMQERNSSIVQFSYLVKQYLIFYCKEILGKEISAENGEFIKFNQDLMSNIFCNCIVSRN